MNYQKDLEISLKMSYPPRDCPMAPPEYSVLASDNSHYHEQH